MSIVADKKGDTQVDDTSVIADVPVQVAHDVEGNNTQVSLLINSLDRDVSHQHKNVSQQSRNDDHGVSASWTRTFISKQNTANNAATFANSNIFSDTRTRFDDKDEVVFNDFQLQSGIHDANIWEDDRSSSNQYSPRNQLERKLGDEETDKDKAPISVQHAAPFPGDYLRSSRSPKQPLDMVYGAASDMSSVDSNRDPNPFVLVSNSQKFVQRNVSSMGFPLGSFFGAQINQHHYGEDHVIDDAQEHLPSQNVSQKEEEDDKRSHLCQQQSSFERHQVNTKDREKEKENALYDLSDPKASKKKTASYNSMLRHRKDPENQLELNPFETESRQTLENLSETDIEHDSLHNNTHHHKSGISPCSMPTDRLHTIKRRLSDLTYSQANKRNAQNNMPDGVSTLDQSQQEEARKVVELKDDNGAIDYLCSKRPSSLPSLTVNHGHGKCQEIEVNKAKTNKECANDDAQTNHSENSAAICDTNHEFSRNQSDVSPRRIPSTETVFPRSLSTASHSSEDTDKFLKRVIGYERPRPGKLYPPSNEYVYDSSTDAESVSSRYVISALDRLKNSGLLYIGHTSPRRLIKSGPAI